MVSPQTSPTASETVHRRRWLILGILLASVLVVVLDSTILNVALKRLAEPAPEGIGASQADLEWTINSYTLVFAGLLFTAGVLGDRFGRKKMLLIGMALFGAASALSAFSSTPGQLITYRSLMGLGGALITPATLAVVVNVFPPQERAKAIGIWSGVVGLAIAAGPILAGALLHWFWWGSVFLVNVPIAVVALVLMVMFVPDSKDPRPGRFDPPGMILSTVGLASLVYGIIKGGQLGDVAKPEVWGFVLAGLVLLAAWAVAEHRRREPAFDVGYFRDRRFSASISAIGIMAFGLNGVVFFFVFYTQTVRGYSALQSGLLLLPMAASQMYFAPRARLVVERFGARATCAGALAVMAVSFLGFLLLDRTSPIWVMEISFFLLGIGTAHVLPPATVMVMTALPQEKAGSASAINNAFRQIGTALGVAVLGSLLSYAYHHQVDDVLRGLPAGARHGAEESISATHAVVTAPDLLRAADDAFVAAMHTTALAAALVALLGAAVSIVFLPAPPPKPAAADAEPQATSTSEKVNTRR